MGKYYCPCCGYDTFNEEPQGNYDICPICFWEDDPIQLRDPHYRGGANCVSLLEAQANFELFGACEKEMIRNVRSPNPNDIRNPDWQI